MTAMAGLLAAFCDVSTLFLSSSGFAVCEALPLLRDWGAMPKNGNCKNLRERCMYFTDRLVANFKPNLEYEGRG